MAFGMRNETKVRRVQCGKSTLGHARYTLSLTVIHRGFDKYFLAVFPGRYGMYKFRKSVIN